VEDFYKFMGKFLFFQKTIPPGPINVVNTGSIEAKEIIDIMKKHGINNPNWKFVGTVNTVAQRSNCILSTEKLKPLGLELPSVYESLERDISKFSTSIQR